MTYQQDLASLWLDAKRLIGPATAAGLVAGQAVAFELLSMGAGAQRKRKLEFQITGDLEPGGTVWLCGSIDDGPLADVDGPWQRGRTPFDVASSPRPRPTPTNGGA